jgi:hypothetical protein
MAHAVVLMLLTMMDRPTSDPATSRRYLVRAIADWAIPPWAVVIISSHQGILASLGVMSLREVYIEKWE